MRFIKLVLEPARYINNAQHYHDVINHVSAIISFIGYEIREDGKIYKCKRSVTLSDAEERATNLKNKLKQRNAHEEIFKYCSPELITNNYFSLSF